jgi:diguanylate cyclase (GGDEF)-like protein
MTPRMKDEEKTQEQLIRELNSLRQRVMALEQWITDQKKEGQTAVPEQRDVLPGLQSNALFKNHFVIMIAQANLKNSKFALMLIAIDNLDEIKKTNGDAIVNPVVKAVSNRVTSTLRKTDIITLTEQKEFLILIPEYSWLEVSVKIAQRMLKSFEKPFLLNDREIHATLNIGIAVYPDDALDADSLINCAQAALGHARQDDKRAYAYHFYNKKLK